MSTQLTAIEATAAGHMLSTYPAARLTIDSAYTTADAAPGGPTGRYRPSARTTALATALQATVGSDVKDDGMRLRLSEPQVFGDTARITVTLHWGPQAGGTRGQSGYHTRRFTMVREGEAWRVAEVRELGIT